MANNQSRRRAVSVIGMVLVSLLLFAPAVVNALISLKGLSSAQGLWLFEAPWVGLDNVRGFMQMQDRGAMMGNSLLMAVSSFACSLVLGTLYALFIPRIAGHGRRGIAMGVLLVPLFIPAVCMAIGMLQRTSGTPLSFSLHVIFAETLAGAGIIGFSGAACEMATPGRGFLRGIGYAALLRCFLLLTPSAERIAMLSLAEGAMPLMTMDAFGMVAETASLSAAVHVMKSLIQFISGLIVAVGAYFLFVRGRRQPLDSVRRDRRSVSFSGWFACIAPLLAGSLLLVTPMFSGESDVLSSAPSGMQYLLTAGTGVAAYCITVVMIHGLRRLPFVPFAALAGLLLSSANPATALLYSAQALGIAATPYPAIFAAIASPESLMLIFICAKIARAEFMKSRPVRLLALLPACYAAATFFGDAHWHGLFGVVAQPKPTGLVLAEALKQSTVGGGVPMTSLVPFIITLLLPLALFVISCMAATIYLDRQRISLLALAPKHQKAAENVVENDHKDVVEEIAEIRDEPQKPDDDAHEDHGKEHSQES